MKERISKWWSEFRQDLIFNIIMTIVSTVLVIIMFILMFKCLMAVWEVKF